MGLLAETPNGEMFAKASKPERFWPGLEGTGETTAEVEDEEVELEVKGFETGLGTGGVAQGDLVLELGMLLLELVKIFRPLTAPKGELVEA